MDYFRNIGYKIKTSLADRLIKLLPVYYTTIHKLPVANWFKLQDGDYGALYFRIKFKRIPSFFGDIAKGMLFEFDNLDLSLLRKHAYVAVLKSMAARTKNKTIEFNANKIQKEIDNELSLLINERRQTLNEFIDYIEITFNQIGSQDPNKLTTARAFSLYQRAKEKNEHLKNLRKTN